MVAGSDIYYHFMAEGSHGSAKHLWLRGCMDLRNTSVWDPRNGHLVYLSHIPCVDLVLSVGVPVMDIWSIVPYALMRMLL